MCRRGCELVELLLAGVAERVAPGRARIGG
jgi:hypothetical protein